MEGNGSGWGILLGWCWGVREVDLGISDFLDFGIWTLESGLRTLELWSLSAGLWNQRRLLLPRSSCQYKHA